MTNPNLKVIPFIIGMIFLLLFTVKCARVEERKVTEVTINYKIFYPDGIEEFHETYETKISNNYTPTASSNKHGTMYSIDYAYQTLKASPFPIELIGYEVKRIENPKIIKESGKK